MTITSERIRVAIADDYAVVVAGVAAVLRPHADVIEVVELDVHEPVVCDVDVVLYDSFGQPQGADINLDDLLQPGNNAKVAVFSWNTEPDLVQQSLQAGIAGYIPKAVTGAELADALRRIHAGELVTPQTQGQPETPDQPADDTFGDWPGSEYGLSARESEVLALICQGLSNDEIAQRAFIGINTVKTYIRTAYRKIDVDSRTKAVLWGMAHGFAPDRTRAIKNE